MCTGAEVDRNLIDSDHAGVKLWLYVRKIRPETRIRFQDSPADEGPSQHYQGAE